MALIYKTLSPSDFPAAAALIESQSRNPQTHCIHASSGEAIENLFEEMQRLTEAGEMAWVGSATGGELDALFGAEFDPESGRAWLRGPFDLRPGEIDPRFWPALLAALPEPIRRFDTFLNAENLRGRRFYEMLGFTERGRVHVYEASRERAAPEAMAMRSEGEIPVPIEPPNFLGFAALHDACFPGTFITGEQILGKLDETHRIWVTTRADQVTGYIFAVLEDWAASGYIEFVGVGAAERGQGLGGRLLQAALGWFFDDAGVETVGLTVNDENTNARGLYERSGFRLQYTGVNQRLSG